MSREKKTQQQQQKGKAKQIQMEQATKRTKLYIPPIYQSIGSQCTIVKRKRNSIIFKDNLTEKLYAMMTKKEKEPVNLGEVLSIKDGEEKILDYIRQRRIEKHPEWRKKETVDKPKKEEYKSRYRGVSWDSTVNRWKAWICKSNKKVQLGVFPTEEEAALAYNKAAIEHRGLNTKTVNYVPEGVRTEVPLITNNNNDPDLFSDQNLDELLIEVDELSEFLSDIY